MNIDYEKLRSDLIDYYGTAISFHPMALMDVSKVKNADPKELVEIALKNGFDLEKYVCK